MQVEITIKNYRCFQDSNPARITLSKGFVAFLGTNNSGKSSLLKFFYEFRDLFLTLSNIDAWSHIISNQQLSFSFPREVLDSQEVFCNINNRPLEIELRFIESPPTINSLSFLNKIIITTISRTTSDTVKIYLDNRLLKTDGNWIIYNTHLQNNRDIVVDISYIIEIFRDLSKTIYIGPFRNALSLIPILDPGFMKSIDQQYFNYFDIRVGRAFIQQWRRFKTGSSRKNNKISLSITEDIKHIFEFNNLEINSSDDDQTIKMFIDGNPYTLSELGSGLAQFFIVLANVAVEEPSYILIDEPELNLNPLLQLDFLTTLGNYAKKGVLFATHSIGLARSSAEQIYTVRKSNDGSEVREYEKNPHLSELLGELSFSTYKELGFNKILLVEGPTEIKTIQQFLRKHKKDHEIVLLPLGGSSLINDSSEPELVEIKRISNKISVLIDSERKSPDAKLESKRQAFLDTCQRIGISHHALERRAIENYFSDRAVKLVKGSNFQKLQPYEKLADVPGWGKAENWKIAREMTVDELEGTDLGDFIKDLCKKE